jgi:Sir2- and TIR-associating SLOG family/SIR2-like domain
MEMTSKQKDFIKDIAQKLEEDSIAIFAGAGLSLPAGFADWVSLLKKPAQEIGLDSSQETDLIRLAQYCCNRLGRAKLDSLIRESFTSLASTVTDNHLILSRLPIKIYWTTNYDKLIENALEKSSKAHEVKHNITQLTKSGLNGHVIVYKMHGDVSEPDRTILTKDDYERYNSERKPFVTALSHHLVSKTFIFIGFSFTDPNLEYILTQVRLSYPDDSNKRYHYYFLINIESEEHERDEDFQYRKRKQSHLIEELKRYNVRVVLVDKYEDITVILREIENIYKSKSIFISGSAHEYFEFSEKREEAEKFIHDLSREIVKKGYRIISGFGLGVGSSVVSGALDEIYKVPEGTTDAIDPSAEIPSASLNQLAFQPFPQSTHGRTDLPKLWETYRKDMISRAGVALFLFGNKLDGTAVINASGVKKEFDIAREQGLVLLPIGRTGYLAKELWAMVNKEFDIYHPNLDSVRKAKIKEAFRSLNQDNLEHDALIQTVIDILQLLTTVESI